METNMAFQAAQALLCSLVTPVDVQPLALADCLGRVLGQDLTATCPLPPFDRSPYDGYAFRAADSQAASPAHPVTLSVLDTLPAGSVPVHSVTAGAAVRLMTGAPIPKGADAVLPYEQTAFTDTTVTLSFPVASGTNCIRAGEDIAVGQTLARSGDVLEPGLLAAFAAQGVTAPLVHRRPRVGILATGSEVVEPDAPLPAGHVRNFGRYALAGALGRMGCEAVYLGAAADSIPAIAALLLKGLAQCDALILTGGVSAGDYDLTPAALERAGVTLCAQGVAIKPGGACVYGTKDGKLISGLSGNPAAALLNLYAVVRPALFKLCGRRDVMPALFPVVLCDAFLKPSPVARLLWGRLDVSDGRARVHLAPHQGSAGITGMLGCDMLALVPAHSGPLAAGTQLKGFML